MPITVDNNKIAKTGQDLIRFSAEEHCLRWGARPSKPLRCDYVPGGFDSYLFRQFIFQVSVLYTFFVFFIPRPSLRPSYD